MINTLRPRQNGCHFADNIFKCIFLNENVWISLKFVPKGPINNIPAMVQIMVWRCPGNKLLSEPMVVNLLTHICIVRPQWVRGFGKSVSKRCKVTAQYESCLPRNKVSYYKIPWPPSQNEDCLSIYMGIPISKIRLLCDHLIFNMRTPILVTMTKHLDYNPWQAIP